MQRKRLPLGEIHDQPWCPKVIRNGVTDFFQYYGNNWEQYTPLLPTLCHVLRKVEAERVIDLCSGGGGPWQTLSEAVSHDFGRAFRIVLTDRYPNLAAFRLASLLSGGIIEFREEPLDARLLPKELSGFRTLFSSFHHFDTAQAKCVLQDAVDSGQGIGIFEMTNRSSVALLAMLVVPFIVLMHTPKIRPFCWARLLLTYLLPIIPFIVMVDSIISCLRSYTTNELVALTGSLTGTPYDWEIRELESPKSPFPITYAIGCPKPRCEEQNGTPCQG